MKAFRLQDFRLPRPLFLMLGALGLLCVAIGLFVVRLGSGPIDTPWLRGTVEQALAGQVRGGQADVSRVRLVWFDRVNSLGLELSGVRLVDHRRREVLKARQVEAGVALDALPGFRLTLGRVAAHDFSAAFSVSKRGRYQLGYEADGAPGTPARLDGLLGDLTGRPRLSRPLSYFRQLDLRDGRLSLRQIGGTVNWTADVRQARFDKTGGKLLTDISARLADGRSPAPATLELHGKAAQGLSDARLWARLDGLVPARTFPSAGATRPLSTLDAVVMGRGSIAYDFKAGVRAADVRLEAGQGALVIGGGRDDFQSAQLLAVYDPATRRVELKALRLFAEKTRLDLAGHLSLLPEDAARKRPARLDFSIGGPRLFASLASDAPSQELADVTAVGRYTPALRRFELTSARGQLAGAPATARGLFVQDDRGRWSADFDARVGGVVTPDQIFAFWPRRLTHDLRDWLRRSILSGRISNAAFAIDAQPGAFARDMLRDEDLNISFDFADAGFRFADEFPAITQGVGRGVVRGNRFDLSLASGRMDTVALSEGSIEIPRFKPRGQPATFKVRAVGDAQALLQVIDGPKLQIMTRSGLAPARVAGQADVRVEIVRPMLHDVPFDDHKITYVGTVKQASLKQAALGWDLTGGDLKVEGDQEKVAVEGVGTVGPYRGRVDFTTRYHGAGDKSQNIDLEGLIQASWLGGRPGQTLPFGGKFKVSQGVGTGVAHSPMFEGRVSWKPGDGRDRVLVEGWGGAAALRRVGVPFLESVPERFPFELKLSRTGETWRGPVRADALSGNIAFTGGQRARMVYDAEISPIEARRIGLGRMPLFEQSRPVVVDANWSGGQGAAQVRAGQINLAIGWTRSANGPADHRLRADLTNADLAALGVPGIARPNVAVPVTASWRSGGEGLVGTGEIDGLPVRFTTAPVRGGAGATAYALRADLDRATLRRLGAPDLLEIDGLAALNAHWLSSENKPTAGRVELDFARAALSVAHSDWRKPAGQAARVSADFVQQDDGALRLARITGDGQALDLDGSALVAGGKLISLDLGRARLPGLLDAAVKAARDPQNGVMSVAIRGKWLDARRLFDGLSDAATPGAPGHGGAPLRLEAALEGLRLTDAATLRDVRATGVMGSEAVRRLDLTAASANGGRVKGRLYPLNGATAVSAETTDAGDLARTLFGLETLKGGSAVLTGRLVPGGADLNLEMKNVRLIRAPTMAQILTLASLRGLTDTLNGEGVMFTRVVAPVQLRGRRILVGEARATGSALGLTTKGVADLGADTLDFQGTIAPAYALNSAIGNVPVLGELLTSRKGEGVVGLGYSAKGSFEKPQVYVNPLSLMTPGILRRMFEGPPPSADAGPPAVKSRRPASKTRAGEP